MTDSAAKRQRYSVVIPVYNEQDSIVELHREVTDVFATIDADLEILFVDDGSQDETAAHIRRLADQDSRVRLLPFVTNFGKAAAYAAAFDACRGDLVITLDGDLQDDPNEIPRMREKLDEGYDMVIGWKQGRFDNEPHKAMPSKVFNGLAGLVFGLRLRDANCGFRLMRRAVAKSLVLYGDQYRFIPQLAHVQGFRVTEIGVNHRKRKHGKSKYGPKRFWTGLLDLFTVRFITSYRQRPLHFFGTLGLVPFVLGVGLEVYVLIAKLMGGNFRTHVAAIIIGVMLILMGFQCITTGLIGEMLSAENRRRKYVLEDRDD